MRIWTHNLQYTSVQRTEEDLNESQFLTLFFFLFKPVQRQELPLLCHSTLSLPGKHAHREQGGNSWSNGFIFPVHSSNSRISCVPYRSRGCTFRGNESRCCFYSGSFQKCQLNTEYSLFMLYWYSLYWCSHSVLLVHDFLRMFTDRQRFLICSFPSWENLTLN